MTNNYVTDNQGDINAMARAADDENYEFERVTGRDERVQVVSEAVDQGHYRDLTSFCLARTVRLTTDGATPVLILSIEGADPDDDDDTEVRTFVMSTDAGRLFAKAFLDTLAEQGESGSAD